MPPRNAQYSSHHNSKNEHTRRTLTCKYTVQSGGLDTDGISIKANAFGPVGEELVENADFYDRASGYHREAVLDHSAIAGLTVKAPQSNQNRAPEFGRSHYTFEVTEGNTYVGSAIATDPNTQDSVTGYQLKWADNKAFKVNSDEEEPVAAPEPPTVASVAISGSRDVPYKEPYVTGDLFTMTVIFDADVTMAGTPQFKLQVGTPYRTKARKVDCAADEGISHALVCAYTIQDKEIDRDGNGVSYPKNALVLPSGASITHADDAGVDAEVSMKGMTHNRNFMVNKVGDWAK